MLLRKKEDKKNIVYNSIVEYHNSLVETRFLVSGLVLSANGFLAVGFFQKGTSSISKIAIGVLGILIAKIFWIIEIRTCSLLRNLGSRGRKLEKALCIQKKEGFFSLLKNQPKGLRFLILRFIEFKPKGFLKKLFSHSFGLGLLYFSLCVFWILMIVFELINI